MPDWKKFVRDRLHLKGLNPLREAELIEDVAQQLEDVYQESLKHGNAPSEAISLAQQHIPDWNKFSTELLKTQSSHRLMASERLEERLQVEQFRTSGWRHVIAEFFQDLIYGARMLRKNLRFTAVAALTIALGIGATTAIFSVVNAVILQPLPYDHPERILWLWGTFSQGDHAAISPPDFLDYREHSKSFEQIAAMHIMHQFVPAPLNLTTPGGLVKLDSAKVTSGFFEVFGARAQLGRTFLRSDEQQERNIVVLSHAAWQQHFGSDTQIVGKSIVLNQSAFTVIGVMREGFRYPQDADVWTPMLFGDDEMKHRQFHFLRPIGRVRKGVPLKQAQAELATIASQLEKQYPETNRTWSVRLQTLQEQMVGDLHTPMFIIFGAVLFLLLIACVNVANLQLAKTTARHKEIAIRAAMGAGRKRIVRQLLAESLLLSLPAGFLGLLLAYWSLQAFQATSPEFLPRLQEVRIDTWTLLFTLVCSIFTAVLVSIFPAFDVMPHISAERLKEGKFAGTRTAAGRMRHVLAITEIALSLILLAGAGLLLKSFWNLTRVDLGFEPSNLMTVRLMLDDKKYPDRDAVVQFVEAAMQKVNALPGVESVTAGTGLPLIPAGGDRFFTIDGRPLPSSDADKPDAQFRNVTKDYFHTLAIPVLRGRVFSNQDHEKSQEVVVVNDAFARKFFGAEDALGKYINIDDGEPFHAQIIGIVKGTRQNLVNPPDPEMYVLHTQKPMAYFLLTVRSRTGSAIQAETLRAALRELDRDLAFQKFRTMDEIRAHASIRNRLNAILLAGAAIIALLLAAVGIYGVLSFSVEQRQQEIGVRLALGAQRSDVLTMILQNGIHLAVAGLLIGITGALILTRLMRTLLFNVSPDDPLILAAVSLLLSLVAVIACLFPAYRATRTDPLRTLRYE
jgi:predicted permease